MKVSYLHSVMNIEKREAARAEVSFNNPNKKRTGIASKQASVTDSHHILLDCKRPVKNMALQFGKWFSKNLNDLLQIVIWDSKSVKMDLS